MVCFAVECNHNLNSIDDWWIMNTGHCSLIAMRSDDIFDRFGSRCKFIKFDMVLFYDVEEHLISTFPKWMDFFIKFEQGNWINIIQLYELHILS